MTLLDPALVVRTIHSLPALPSIVLDLISSFDREDVDLALLADKISRDQALAAKTLRLANSSFYGLPKKVGTVRQAIVVLGFDSARALAVACSIIGTFSDARCKEIDVAVFWRHSIAVALCARNLARRAGLDQEHAFIAALLHDIGRLVLASRFPEQYALVAAYCERQGTTVDEGEEHVLGMDHQRIGQMLAENWKFPAMIQRAIGQHHQPANADLGGVPGIVHVADAMVKALDLGGDEHVAVPPLQDAVWDCLHLGPEQLQAVCRETEGQFEEACQLLM